VSGPLAGNPASLKTRETAGRCQRRGLFARLHTRRQGTHPGLSPPVARAGRNRGTGKRRRAPHGDEYR
jgi:hypothetical protein